MFPDPQKPTIMGRRLAAPRETRSGKAPDLVSGRALPGQPDLVRPVVPMLLRVEPAPLATAQIRQLGPEQTVGALVSVGDDEPGDLVVALVAAEAAVVGVKRGRR